MAVIRHWPTSYLTMTCALSCQQRCFHLLSLPQPSIQVIQNLLIYMCVYIYAQYSNINLFHPIFIILQLSPVKAIYINITYSYHSVKSCELPAKSSINHSALPKLLWSSTILFYLYAAFLPTGDLGRLTTIKNCKIIVSLKYYTKSYLKTS